VLGMEWNFLEPRVCGERGSAHWREFAEALVAMLQFHLPPRSHFLASDVHPMCTPSAQLDDDADYRTAYQSARTVGVNGGSG
jgi:hypothetical protein